MNEKAHTSRRGARRSASTDTTSAQPPNKMGAGHKSGGTDADVNPIRDFHDRQAQTDAAVRTIPGLHNFGN
ncbi:MAG: hypothetical protein U0Q18_32940 [Bryobacteraceae bacterium]